MYKALGETAVGNRNTDVRAPRHRKLADGELEIDLGNIKNV